MQIDFCAAIDRGNHEEFLHKLCSVGKLEVPCFQYLSNRSQHVVVDGCLSKLVNITSGVPQRSFGHIIVPPVHLGSFLNSGE